MPARDGNGERAPVPRRSSGSPSSPAYTGTSRGAIGNAISFFGEVLANPRTLPELDMIKYNVEFLVLPAECPDGIERGGGLTRPG